MIRLPGRRSPKDAEKGESQDELDAHVEDVLSKRANIRRGLQGLWAYLKTPIGVVTGTSSADIPGGSSNPICRHIWVLGGILGSGYRPIPS